jgi:peptide deformylase
MLQYIYMNLLARQVGDPIIRKILADVGMEQIDSNEVRECIEKMKAVNEQMKGVGISANQVGYDMRICVIHIQASANRTDVKPSKPLVMINPEIIENIGQKELMWEGCLSVAEAGIFAQIPRYKSVMIKYLSPAGAQKTRTLTDLQAQIAQHELDHLDGRILLDHDYDTSTLMSASEYRKVKAALDNQIDNN